jgi:hypothetical protein
MKKIITFISIVLAISSCSKDFLKEEPKAAITTQTFYKTQNDLDMATLALYANFAGVFDQVTAPVYGSDDITVLRAGNKFMYSDFDVFSANSSSPAYTNMWIYLYNTIKQSNALLANYSNATVPEDSKNVVAGQAYFFRAISYFYLTRLWGAVPLVETTVTDYTIKVSQPQDIYTLIVSDLQKAETMVPDNYTGDRNKGGVNIPPTKGAVKALLADVYLTMAGWPLKQTDKYALAAAKAKEVIDNKTTWNIDLLPNFADLWKKEGQYNKETVFGCYYNGRAAGAAWDFNGNMNGPESAQPVEEGGWDDGFAELTFFKKFPAGPRKDATFQTDMLVDGKLIPWTECQSKHPYYHKFIDDYTYNPVTRWGDWWGDHTEPVIRYADVLLVYAEAKAMSGGADQSAYAAINAVRNRAGLPNLKVAPSNTAFRDSVIVERGWEFAGLEPNCRWYDLIRTETVAKANSFRDPAEEPLIGKPDDTQHTFYWAPIPINDTDLNSNLK